MEIFTNKNRIKRISLILIILTVLTSVLPLYSIYAGDTEDPTSQAQEEAMTDEEVGGKLFRPIFKLFAGVGDLVIKGLQKIFLGNGDIRGDGIDELDRDDAAFFIRYSPAVIFSNTIPGLDANFIKPKPDQFAKEVTGKATEIKTGLSLDDSSLKNTYGFDVSTLTPQYTKTNNGFFNIENAEEHLQYSWLHNGKQYSLVNTTNIPDLDIYKIAGLGFLTNGGMLSGTVLTFIDRALGGSGYNSNNWNLYEYETTTTVNNNRTLKSAAGQLQETVSKWYKSLRLFALVGLLSVLVYIGIRILISSTGQEKAKYKKMIMDWIAAICILFMLQYIMSFTMTIVENLTEVFRSKVIDDNGVDVLMSNIRQNINLNVMSGITSFACLIMYLALVVYTVVFTVHYLKRLVYLAFFTMIAPLIAFTYPLDKIKDGQAQAFGMWIKEYIFNALIPVLHMLIYSMFVGSALDLVSSNPLYAIVCIAFLIPAEKFMRKMFGFDKATTSGQLGAAAGGAMVMNAINKIGHKPPKAGPENPAKVRTTGSGGNTGGYAIGGLDSPGGANPLGGAGPLGGANPPGGAGPLGGANPPGGAGPLGGANPPGGAGPLGGANPPGGAGPLGGANPPGGANPLRGRRVPKRAIKGSVGQGIKNVVKRYINRNTPKKIGKGLGRGLRRGLVGAAGAAALGTFGLAAGVASGDLGNVAKYTGAAMAAGGVGAARLSDIAAKEEKQNREAFKQGYFGKEEYEARDTIEQVWQNQDISDQYKIGKKSQFKEDAREFTDSGITDKNEIIAAMQMKEQHPGLTNSDAVTIAKLNKKVSKGTYGNPSKTTTINRVKREIAKSLRNQGFTGDADQEAARQIRLMDAMKQNLNKL